MPRDDHYAIAIGIDDYPALRRLRSSVRDATRVCEWLTAPDGGDLPDENVKLITSPGVLAADAFEARPVQDQIDRALRDFGAERPQRIGERLYFYFAGHGFGPTFNEVGMLMASATMGSLGANIGLQAYRLFFQKTRLFDEVVYFLDCCRDPEQSVGTLGPRFNGNAVVAGAKDNVSDFLVLAAAYGAKAFAPVNPMDGEPRGLLTEALLNGLKGTPRAVDTQGKITAASLRQYVLETVKSLAGNAKLQQDPDVPALPLREIVFREIDTGTLPRVAVQIVVPDEYANGEVILRDGFGRELSRKPVNEARAANPWAVGDLLVNSRYELEHTGSDYAVTFDPGKSGQNPYVFKLPRPA